MKNPVLVGAVAFMSILAPSDRVAAQIVGELNPAAWFPAPDPLAFGVQSKVALEGYQATWQRIYMVHFPVGDGALRLMGGEGNRRTSFGAGYSRQLLRRDLGAFRTFTLGGEATLAYSNIPIPFVGVATVGRLTAPMAWRRGRENGFAFTSYFVPFAELGSMPRNSTFPPGCLSLSPDCVRTRTGQIVTHAFGIGVGLKFSIPYVDLHLAIRDGSAVGRRETDLGWLFDRGALGVSVRLPR